MTVITTPWRTLCVNLVGPYTLKGKDGSVIDFVALTMIDPASSWFKIVDCPKSGDIQLLQLMAESHLHLKRLSTKA